MRRFIALFVAMTMILFGCGQIETVDDIKKENSKNSSEVIVEMEEGEDEIVNDVDSSAPGLIDDNYDFSEWNDFSYRFVEEIKG